MINLELFAGVGFAEGLNTLGLTGTGLELDPAACATRRRAGHPTIPCDVTQHPTAPFADSTDGLIGGPPCPPFGKSGKKLGLTDLPLVHQAIDDLARGRDSRAVHGAGCLDPRSILTAEPMRWLHALRPRWVVMEQVPAVLPVWQHYAAVLGGWGYSTAAGVVDAAGYGLPQQRKRAIFLASRVREVALPAPTHGGPGQPPLVPMVAGVGWGYTGRPAPTVTGGGTATGGAEPFGNGTRRAMRAAMGTPAWRDRGDGGTRPSVEDCAALQGFRPGLVFTGRQGQRYLQVGNAVPPLLAAHVLAAAAGLPVPSAAPAEEVAA